MKHNTKVSVIMGVYNPPSINRFFQSVQSIVKQTLSDWEFIIYNDGSCKACTENIAKIISLDNRIHLIGDRKNHGLAHALNMCMQFASGDYIARMDDDDIAISTRLEKQYRFMEMHAAYHWTGTNALLADEGGIWGLQKMPTCPAKKDFLYNSPFIHPSVMFRRDVLVQSGGYNTSPEYIGCEDYELFMRLYAMGYQGYNLQKPQLIYWEDKKSYQKRTYARRVKEMKLRYKGFQKMGILRTTTMGYVVKPLMVGLLPPVLHRAIKKRLWRKE